MKSYNHTHHANMHIIMHTKVYINYKTSYILNIYIYIYSLTHPDDFPCNLDVHRTYNCSMKTKKKNKKQGNRKQKN